MSPVFAHGQLRLYLLVLLSEAPRHGYEIIQDLEARFGGLYTPSAGTVYPRLAKLEEEGLVARSDEGRKATYRITEAGLAEVRSRSDAVTELQADLDQSVRRLADQVRTTVQGRSADLRAELKAAAREARATARPAGSNDPDHGARQDRDDRGQRGERGDAQASWAPQDEPPADPSGMGGFRGFGLGSPLSGFVFGSRSEGFGAGGAGGSGGSGTAGREWAELERAAYEVRDQARRAWRQHGLTADQTAELVEILADASRRISEVLRRSSRG